jgi:RNA polymerase sigma factor (sigma-70 family)
LPNADQLKAGVALTGVGSEHSDALSAESASILADLYREHAAPMRRYIARRFGAGPPEPEEVIQATFAKMASVENLARLRDPRGFLYTIACNFVIDNKRRSNFRDATLRAHSEAGQVNFPTESSPEEILIGRERFDLFKAALGKMPATRRRIFIMVRVDGMAPSIIARQFGVSESAIHKHVSRALADCAAEFAKAERRNGSYL